MVPLDALGRSTRKPGSVICGKWRIEAHLRSTATSATYSAIHRNGARIALKILHGHLSTDKTLQARFRREAYVANTIPHPDTVKVIDDDETDDGCALLVMDHFDGETLEELRIRKGGKLPVEMATAFLDQLLDIIAAAHDQGVVHRDIKPETVFVTKEGKIKVHDFGTARVLHESSSPHEMTAAGMVVGSPSSMAPEQARGQRDLVDAQSDVFSLGALLFLLISGEQVHNIENPLAALVAAAKSKARSLRTVTGPEVSDAIVEVVDRALAFKKGDRWPDVRAFRAALRAAKGEMIDTFPQAGRRDPLADLMGDTAENPALLMADDGDVQMLPATQPPPAAHAVDSTLLLSSPQAARLPQGLGPQAPKAPAAPKPPAIPSAPASAPKAPVMAARIPKAPTSSPTGPTGPTDQTSPMSSGSANVGGGRGWQDRNDYEDTEDAPTLARSPLDPELMAALADVRRGVVGVAPSRDVPRVTPSSPPRPGTPSSPPRPGGPPRPGSAPTAPKAPAVPQIDRSPTARMDGSPEKPGAARAPVVAKLARPSAPALPPPLPSAPASAPSVPSHRDDGKDPRFATVVMAGSPGDDRPKLQRPSFDLPPSDEHTMVDLPAMPPSAPPSAPEVHAAMVVGRAPQPPANPPGFAYMQPPAYPQQQHQQQHQQQQQQHQQQPMGGMGMPNPFGPPAGRPGFDLPPMRPPMGSSGGLRAPTPFEVFEAAPPPPQMPPMMQVPLGEFPGRRLSMHEDLRILVPEQSLMLDHNPFADAAKRRRRITIGVVSGVVLVVLIALVMMARSG